MSIQSAIEDLLNQAYQQFNQEPKQQEVLLNQQDDLFKNDDNHNQINRVKTSNSEHQDYGRFIAMARKDLYNYGKLNINTFNDLSEQEQIEQVSKKSIWHILDKEYFKHNGFSPFGFHLVKALRDSLPTKPNTDRNIKLSNDVRKSVKFTNLLYIIACNEIKDFCHDIKFNFDDKITRIDFAIFFENNTRFLDSDFPEYCQNALINAFPDNKDEIKSIDKEIILQALWEQIPAIKSLIKYDGKILYKAQKQLKKQPTWDDIIQLKVEKDDDLSYIDNIDNLEDMFNLITKTKIRTSHNNMSVVKVDSVLSHSHLDSVVRNGYDYIDGDKIKAETLDKTFGIDAMQWGNWINESNERQNLLNLVYESFTDLAATFNIVRDSIGLEVNNRGLGFGIGSQGISGSRAHYQTGQKFLHMNRKNSAGSLAHEWFHAYDHYLYEKAMSEGILSQRLIDGTINNSETNFLSVIVTRILSRGTIYDPIKKEYIPHKDFQDEFNKIKNFNPAFFELILKINGLDTKRYISLEQLSPSEMEFISNEDTYASNVNLSKKIFELHKESFHSLKTEIKNLTMLIDVVKAYEEVMNDVNSNPDQKNSAESILLNLMYKNSMILSNNLNRMLPNTDEAKPFKKILLSIHEDGRGKNKIEYKENVNNYLSNKDTINQLILNNLKDIYKDVFTQEAVNQSSEIFYDVMEKYIHQIKQSAIEKILTQKAENKDQTIFHAAYQHALGPTQSANRKEVNFFYFSRAFWVHKDIVGTIDEFTKDSVKNGFIPELKQQLQDNNVHPLLVDKIIGGLLSNKKYIENALKENIEQSLQSNIALQLVNDGYGFEIKMKSKFKQDAEALDLITNKGKAYYATPYELFARMGETVVGNLVYNTYLCKEKYSNFFEQLSHLQVYPNHEELKEYIPLLKQSLKISFPLDFDVDLSNKKMIKNEYSKNEILIDDISERSESKAKKTRKNKP